MISLYMNSSKIFEKIAVADTFFKRLKGFMFCKETNVKVDALLIVPCNSIHTFFMKFNIDVLFLNDKMEVVHIERNLCKNRIIKPIKNVKLVLESKAHKFEKLKIGDVLKLKKGGQLSN